MQQSNHRDTQEKYRVLLDINNAIITSLDRESLFEEVTRTLGNVVPFDRANIMLYIPEADGFRPYVRSGPAVVPNSVRKRILPREGSLLGRVLDDQQPSIQAYSEEDQSGQSEIIEAKVVQAAFFKQGFRSSIVIPMVTPRRPIGTLNLTSRTSGQYSESDGAFLCEAAKQIALALENMLAYEEIAELKDRLEEENLYLIQEIKTEHSFDELVGQSSAFKKVLQAVETVASTDAGVLLLGETGTGKELVARAVHLLSPRKDKMLIKVNCASLPANLIESEIFGHEKGAFTGAIARKIGRFELADGGTLFLDEIGDLPLELQVKLLRVLQEGMFERVGGADTIEVDVRIIAATNRNLERAIEEGAFRQDLFYRLNVFPIHLPPLRERQEDILPLVRHFVSQYSARFGKQIDTIPQKTINVLQRYPWPGNVRELENVIERAVIVSRGSQLELGEWFSKEADATSRHIQMLTLEDVEREHIVKVLELTGWRISGEYGAAKTLGMKRTTLQSRMKKFGIRRPM